MVPEPTLELRPHHSSKGYDKAIGMEFYSSKPQQIGRLYFSHGSAMFHKAREYTVRRS